ncbi:hypothetical protein [Shewanella algae]|uniref:hypothetical protein n=1 Tax=Shewanella algae TaxID=38313 RepID=UPI000D1395A1|nr:hypothetical protein [Shewanella algae]PSS70307.1 hypothetical protein AYI85_06825 [Shewanella algae]
MGIEFDVVMDSKDYSIEMNAGLETLLGASETTRRIVETVLTERVPEKLTNSNKVQSRLKKTFQGSFGQRFSLEIEDEKVKRKMRSIGKEVIIELIQHFVNEGLYRQPITLSAKAKKRLKELDQVEDKLIDVLRKSSFEHLHSLSSNFGRDVKLRYRKNLADVRNIANINRSSCATLKPKINRMQSEIVASITRLNIHTGNGRLQLIGSNETVAFGFEQKYHLVPSAIKSRLSNDLDHNNKVAQPEWSTLKLRVHTLNLKSGKIVKYIIEELL